MKHIFQKLHQDHKLYLKQITYRKWSNNTLRPQRMVLVHAYQTECSRVMYYGKILTLRAHPPDLTKLSHLMSTTADNSLFSLQLTITSKTFISFSNGIRENMIASSWLTYKLIN